MLFLLEFQAESSTAVGRVQPWAMLKALRRHGVSALWRAEDVPGEGEEGDSQEQPVLHAATAEVTLRSPNRAARFSPSSLVRESLSPSLLVPLSFSPLSLSLFPSPSLLVPLGEKGPLCLFQLSLPETLLSPPPPSPPS